MIALQGASHLATVWLVLPLHPYQTFLTLQPHVGLKQFEKMHRSNATCMLLYIAACRTCSYVPQLQVCTLSLLLSLLAPSM